MLNLKKRGFSLGISLILLSIIPVLGWKGFCKERLYFEIASIELTRSNLPCIDIKIEGENYPIMVDLGSRFGLCINDEVLAKLNKTRRGIQVSRNIWGTKFKHPKYIIPKLELGSLCFEKSSVTRISAEEKEAVLIWRKEGKKLPAESIGEIGRGLLKKFNLLFDIQKSRMIATNDTEALQKEGYSVDSFIKIPFKLDYRGIVLKVKTDLGQLKLILDTGTTLTFLKDSMLPKDGEVSIGYHGLSSINSNRFAIGGTEFGPQNLTFLKMADKLGELHGLLGMDFIQNHVIYIDFSKKVLYIQP